MAAGEQIGVSGNPNLKGALIASDVSSTSTTVDESFVSGELHLTCDGQLTNGDDAIRIAFWRID